jgi:hypothetical protein
MDNLYKIRPVRYINENIGKIEEYSKIRALVYVNISFLKLFYYLFF